LALLASLGFFLWVNNWAHAPDYSEGKYILGYFLLMMLNSVILSFLYYFILVSPITLNIYRDMVRGALFAPLSYF
jgi:hypothetical protein